MKKLYYRTVWLSDLHLGHKECKAEYLLQFLNTVQMDKLYLVGDIFDMWAMSRQFRWPDSHNQVLHKLISLSESGCEVIYLPGNHDEALQKYDGMAFGKVDIQRECVHISNNGKRYLVLHGDQFDQDVALGPFNAWIGDKGYAFLLVLNRAYNKFRKWRGHPYRSLAGYIKKHLDGANKAIERYRNACVKHAAELDLDGVICGHIHHPESITIDDIEYHNDGDWQENCTALTESESGEIKLLYWTQVVANQLKAVESGGSNVAKAA